MRTILLTGGTGYIGSAIALHLIKQGYQVIIFDRQEPRGFLSRACHLTPSEIYYGEEDQLLFCQGDYADSPLLSYIFDTYHVSCVIHCAASIEVGLSVRNPALFYENNLIKTFALLESMRAHAVTNIIFSSSAAVYGVPEKTPLSEEQKTSPVNPYGNTKLAIEYLLKDYANAYGIHAIAFRFFNAAGALPDYDLGERHNPETHLIPLILQAAYKGTPFTVFGKNYQTTDGTCIRDYIHIQDIACAHYLALHYMETTTGFSAFNLGSGTGHSVMQCINSISTLTKLPLKTLYLEKRTGDPAQLVADISKAYTILRWKPEHSSLEEIIESAHEFETQNKTTAVLPPHQKERTL
jgi:UDP-glucose 4-epimerase